ncbi:hypothetical protein PBI_PEREGRIN_223 [Rhodococcus phage Peregrin]|nr:hypothetical protein PBI_PEREGRIN_223 [Rhodococcus phage Peregrin]
MPAFDNSYYNNRELLEIRENTIQQIERYKRGLAEIEAEIVRRGLK